RIWSRLHFLFRFAGLTGLVCSGIGAALAFLAGILSTERLQEPHFVAETIRGQSGDPLSRVAMYLMAGGAVLFTVALLIELIVAVRLVAGRRSAFGLNAALQVVLTLALLVAINVYSYRHYVRLDWTRGKQFTLSQQLQSQLSQLRDPTSIIVYQRHKTFGH